MITDYIFEENYVQKINKTRNQVKKYDGKQAMMGMRANVT